MNKLNNFETSQPIRTMKINVNLLSNSNTNNIMTQILTVANQINYNNINSTYSLVTSTNINDVKDSNIFGVLDGHGSESHHISRLISQFLPNQIINSVGIKKLTNTEQIYQELIENRYLKIKMLIDTPIII